MKTGSLVPFLLLSSSLLLPEPASLLLLVCVAAIPLCFLRRQLHPAPAEGALAAAWVYENVASHRERQTVLDRLSGAELAALLETSSELNQRTHRPPATVPSEENSTFVVNELRRHRIQALKEARDRETVSRFVRAAEVNSPSLPPAEIALPETIRLVSSEPDLVVQVLRDWLLLPDSMERFRTAMEKAPALTERLVHTYHLKLDQPGLSPAEEVCALLSLLKPEPRKAYRSELPTLPPFEPTRFDQELVARKFVARVWARISVSSPLSTRN